MKIVTQIVFIFLSFNLLAQKQLGFGFAQVNFDDKTKLEFYSSPNSSIPAQSIQFINDEQINSITIENLEQVQQWLEPKTLWLDFHAFSLRVLSIQGDWFQVVTNETNWQTLWIKRDEKIQYRSWEQFLVGLFNIERKNPVNQSLYSDTTSNKKMEYSGADCFKALSVEGDWIQITTPEYCESFTYWTTQIESAWIKWRSDEQLLVNCFETP